MRLFFSTAFVAAAALFVLQSLAEAEVVAWEVTSRGPSSTPGYEEIVGKLRFEIDPRHPGNSVIADIALAPTNASGRVIFSSDLRIWKPQDERRSNGAAWFEIPNRGGKASINPWFVSEGFTVVSVGWEFDVPAGGDKLRAELPRARNADGSAIRGVVSATFTPDKPSAEQTLSDLEEYPPVDVAGPESRLVVRAQAAYPAGRELPRETWTLEGKKLRLQGGFEPGTTYEISYLAEAPPIAGLGYAAIRDAVSWLKHAPDSPARVRHAYALGSSQCGRLLRDFVYLGFNTDERNRPALDGVIAHIAGAGRLVLNLRWATPRSTAAFSTAAFPFADTAMADPVSGVRDGLLENARVTDAPKIFYINTSTEYWGGGRVAALTHTDPAGEKDIAFPANVRSYYYAGTQHGAAAFPPSALVAGAPLANPVNGNPVTLALRNALHEWVTAGIQPPPSMVPRLGDGTLASVKDVRFPAVPGLGDPRAIVGGPRVPNPLWPDGAGAGAELPLLVPQVDADGNDLAGIRLPDVAVPLGTATGWVFRPAALGSPQELVLLRGAWVPFAATKAQREAAHDPRLSLEERYASKEAYLAKVRAVLQRLIAEHFLNESELPSQLKQASERWDWVRKQTAP